MKTKRKSLWFYKLLMRLRITWLILGCTKTTKSYLKWSVRLKRITNTGAPLLCAHCGGSETGTKVIETMEGIGAVEMQAYCKNCGLYAGYWSYGNWQV